MRFKEMTGYEYAYALENLLSEQMDSDEFFDEVLRAIDTDTKIDIFLNIAQMNDIDVPELD
jgi:hypothetical protein